MTTDANPNVPTVQSFSQRWAAGQFWWMIASCLIIQSALAVDCARQWTPTHDEFWHLPIGLRIWKTGRFDEDVINPPLVRLWASIPLVIGGAISGGDGARQDFGEIAKGFWNANLEKDEFWFLLGRLMIIPCAAISALAIAVWTRAWYGDRAAIVAVLLWASCPTVLANSAIVTHDMPLTTGWLVTLFTLVRFAEKPCWRRSLQFGGALGIAILAKLTAIILIPLCIVLWFVLRFRTSIPSGMNVPSAELQTSDAGLKTAPKWIVLAAQFVAAFGFSVLLINACYLFHGTGGTIASLTFVSPQMKSVQQSLSWIGWLPVPFPSDFIAAFDRLAQDLGQLHPVYLDNTWSSHPFAWYYAAALAYKLPLGTIILILFGFAGFVWPRPGSSDRRYGLFLLIAAVSLPILASRSANQIGIRYILPTFPVLFIFAGQAARWLPFQKASTSFRALVRRVVWGLVIAAPLSLRFHPHHMAYFNEAAGGPVNGGWHLLDSNIDWGQDLHGLRDYLDQHRITDIGLAYYGTVLPSSIGINAHDPPFRLPRAGWYAISVNYVHGRPHVFGNHEGASVRVGLGELGYFRFFTPVTSIGYSINVYHLTHRDVMEYMTELQKQQAQP
jgi:Dolichyl-phosphate-mannose-protein mannosyltransferase